MRQTNTEEIFDELKDRLNKATRYENYILACCPEHDDHHPSFFVYPDSYFCKSCGYSGRTETLLNRLEGVFILKSPKTAKNPFYGWQKRFGGLLETMKFAYKLGQEYPSKMKYVLDRGVKNRNIKKMKLGYLDEFITIPVFRKGKLVGATARNTKQGSRYFIPGKQDTKVLFIPNEKNVEKSDYVYLVFGIFDAIILSQYKCPVVTTITGTIINLEAFENIRKKIIILPDKGEEIIASNLASNLGWRGNLKILEYPIGTKDINDLLLQGHEDKINELERSKRDKLWENS